MSSRYNNALWFCAAWLLCGGASCGDASTASGTDGGAAALSDADAGAYPDQPKCRSVPAFHIGMTQTGEQGLVMASLEEASPTPPQKYENEWTIKFTDPDGAPIPGLDLYKVEPFMPEHGHDGGKVPVISAGDSDGTFNVKVINLYMKDLWEVRLFVHVDDTHDDRLVFLVCIPP